MIKHVAPIKLSSDLREDAYTPKPHGLDIYDAQSIAFCNNIGRKLKRYDIRLSEVFSSWRRSCKDLEALEILTDLTALTQEELLYLLNIDKSTLSVTNQRFVDSILA